MAQQQQSKKNTFNPFEYANNFKNTNYTGYFSDFNQWRDQVSKNMKALSAANQVAVDCAQESARRTAELLQKNAQHSYECLKEASNCRSVEDAHANGADWFSSTLKNTSNNSRELTDIMFKAATEIVDIYNRRLHEALCEFSQTTCNHNEKTGK